MKLSVELLYVFGTPWLKVLFHHKLW